MIATAEFTLDKSPTTDDLRWAHEYWKHHPANPQHAQAQHWMVVRSEEGDSLVNIGVVLGGETMVVTDLYIEPSRRGVAAVKWFMRGVKQGIDSGKMRQVLSPKMSRRATGWWNEIFKTEPYVVHYYNGGRF